MSEAMCNCPAYPYPHPEGVGECGLPDSCAYYGEGCFTCEVENCFLMADLHGDYNPHEEALTAWERNPDYRDW